MWSICKVSKKIPDDLISTLYFAESAFDKTFHIEDYQRSFKPPNQATTVTNIIRKSGGTNQLAKKQPLLQNNMKILPQQSNERIQSEARSTELGMGRNKILKKRRQTENLSLPFVPGTSNMQFTGKQGKNNLALSTE